MAGTGGVLVGLGAVRGGVGCVGLHPGLRLEGSAGPGLLRWWSWLGVALMGLAEVGLGGGR
ncbi:hypothetical protein GCM10027456_62280 [Kineosporia babensis]